MASPKNLRITLVQSSLHWEQPIKNLNHFSKQLSLLKKNETDVIILPEMFTTGFSMNAATLAEPTNGVTMKWMKEIASTLKSAVCGSIIMVEKNKYYNRFIWMNADGTFEIYDKRHLFTMGKEDDTYTRGTESVLINYKEWSICPMICYDLRFPVWSRNQLSTINKRIPDYDILLYVANWPSIRSFAWKQLLVARAIENQSYVAAVNRIGKDASQTIYSGDSVVLDPSGKPLSKIKPNKAALETVSISYTYLVKLRATFPVLMDADTFKVL